MQTDCVAQLDVNWNKINGGKVIEGRHMRIDTSFYYDIEVEKVTIGENMGQYNAFLSNLTHCVC